MPRGPGRPYPSVSLPDAVAIPYGLRDHNASHPMNRILLAEAIGAQPASSAFRDQIAAANKYGLITGNFNSETIALTPLGQRVANPASEEDHLNALRSAMEQVPLFKQLLEHFNNNRLPAANLLKSILERSPFNVPEQWSEEATQVFEATGRFTGVIRDIGANPYVLREAGPPIAAPDVPQPDSVEEGDSESQPEVAVSSNGDSPPSVPPSGAAPAAPSVAAPVTNAQAPTDPSNRQFFIAHGRDPTALAQLQSILNNLDIPYVVAEEEPNVGRPISQKIADLMRACSAGIFIFSGDEEVTDPAGEIVKRPRPNVVYELGAASLLYGQRVVIFKEAGVEFPTDFRDLGYIEYEKDLLSAKSMELLRELIKLRAVKVIPGV